MVTAFLDILSYQFVYRAALAGLLVSVCAAVLGVVLVLKHYSLIGHGLADVSFASLSLALALGLPPLYVSMPVVTAASFAVMAYSQKHKVAGDVAIGVAAAASLAAGVIITSVSGGFNTDVYGYMFGSILAMDGGDMFFSLFLSAAVLLFFGVFYNRLFLVVCDEDFARAAGINVTAYHFLISFLTAVTVVIGMRVMGTLLISSLIIFPVVTARKFAKSFRGLVVTSGVVSAGCFVAGLFLSLFLNLPTGASIVAAHAVLMVLSSLFIRAGR